MDSDLATQLRWFLLIIGIVLVAVIYFFTKRSDRKQPQVSKRKPPVSTDISSRQHETPAADYEDAAGQIADSDQDQPIEPVVSSPADDKDSAQDEKIIILHLQSTPGEYFSGKDILSVAQQQTLKRGGSMERGFFEHVMTKEDGSTEILFYVTNMFQPGTFEWQQMDTFQTSGLSLFTRLPAVLPPLEVFRMMAACAQLFAESLGGSVLDVHHQLLTAEAQRQIEEDMKIYHMRRSQPQEAH